jgi:hypothetical protein
MSKTKWIDHNGQEVPAAYVPAIEKEKTRVVERHMARALKLEKALADFKSDLYQDCDALYDKMRLDANVATRSKKGGFTLTTFSKELKIEFSIDERITFDDHINLAQEKFFAYRDMKIEKTGDKEVSEMISHAFRVRKGKLDTASVLGLMSWNIKHALWQEGVELLKKAISRNVTKRYVQLYQRDAEGEYRTVILNISSI